MVARAALGLYASAQAPQRITVFTPMAAAVRSRVPTLPGSCTFSRRIARSKAASRSSGGMARVNSGPGLFFMGEA